MLCVELLTSKHITNSSAALMIHTPYYIMDHPLAHGDVKVVDQPEGATGVSEKYDLQRVIRGCSDHKNDDKNIHGNAEER